MRRRDREVTDLETIRAMLDAAKVLHLGLVDDGMPYVVPMNFGYTLEDGRLTFYLHGAKEGRKLDVIRKNPVCCVQLECNCAPFEGEKACQYGYLYDSLMAFGKVQVVEDVEEKERALSILMKTQTEKDFVFDERLVSIVTVFRIDCDSFTAKRRPLPPRKQAEAEKNA